MNKIKTVLGIAIVFAITFSCSKSFIDEQNSNDESVQLVKDELTDLADIDAIFDEIDALMDEYDFFGEFKSSTLDCKTITRTRPESTKFPVVIVIDYGEGCENARGVVRKGKVIIERDGPMRKTGSEQISTFDGFSINNKAIEGTKKLKCIEGSDVNCTFENEANLTITKNDTIVINRLSVQTKTWAAGFETIEKEDDEWLFSGEVKITRTNGRSISKTIVVPIHRSFACDYALAGEVVFESEGLPDVTLNYGNGVCDEFATLTVDSEVTEIDLSGKWKKWN